MNTQPEALRLADLIRSRYGNDINDEAATELRRLHALNAELLEALELITQVGDRAATEIARAVIAKATGETNG